MIHPQIEKLLIVQSKDIALQKLQQEIERIPKERAKIEGLIDEENASIEKAKNTNLYKSVLEKFPDANLIDVIQKEKTED